MQEEILNAVFGASLEFGEHFNRPVIEIVEELYPDISEDEKISVADDVEETRNAVEQFFYDHYDYSNEKENQALQNQGKAWIKNNYPWMSDENINRAANRGIYMAWHG